MNLTSKIAIASAFVALAACGGNNANNSADMNATDLNAGMTDMNSTTDMNAGMTDMNATGGMTDMNATGNADMNAGGAGANGTTNSTTNSTTNNSM